ncbi:hypothetical protein SG34_018195 [Thalassomonas viridans]|uniref:Uncharacterized protein n=1 Tax=Thalassomonas viridans TaxID=137584 RepID=A0AAE9Z174_9GAMM|nr:hypothetical protein [Thalassomonas viridans]WDE03323.1 hypothetical protein SG34_018195 [Thalassomonas viridans]
MSLLLLLQSTPKVAGFAVIDSQLASSTWQLLRRSYQQAQAEDAKAVFSVRQEELIGISALLQRLYPGIVTDFTLSKSALLAAATLELPVPGSLKYFNVSITVLPSKKGINLVSVEFGHLSFPGNWLLNILQWQLNERLGDNLGSELLDRVGAVRVSADRFSVDYRLAGSRQSLAKFVQTEFLLVKLRLAADIDLVLVRQYYLALLAYVEKNLKQRLLSRFLGHMFTLAQQRSQSTSSEGSVAENRAAMLALIWYLGPDKLSSIFDSGEGMSATQFLKRRQLRDSLVLHQRVDLQKHFVYSMALQLLANSKTSNIAGEVKELLDAGFGSGFSFVDLLADKAGSRLALLATKSKTSANRVQALLAGDLDDTGIMPFPLGLPEDIHSLQFQTHYRNVNSAAYQQMLQRIESLLALIAVYQVR